MPLTAQEREDFNRNCYGCDPVEFKQSVEDSLTFKLSGPGMVIMSLLSDAQEMVAHGPYDSDTLSNIMEDQRKLINRAKFLVIEYMPTVRG